MTTSTEHTHGDLSVVDHRVPASFAPPAHVHQGSDDILYVVEGTCAGFCGERTWTAGPGSLVFLPRRAARPAAHR